MSGIQRPASRRQLPESRTQPPVSHSQRPASRSQPPASLFQHPANGSQRPVSRRQTPASPLNTPQVVLELPDVALNGWPSLNPEGIPSVSPGLKRQEVFSEARFNPGWLSAIFSNPNGVASCQCYPAENHAANLR